MATIETMKSCLAAIKKDIDSKEENKTVWTPVISLLESYASNINTCFAEQKAKCYFLNEFSGELLQFLTKQSFFSNKDVIYHIQYSFK